MRGEIQRAKDSEYAAATMALGGCLIDADPHAGFLDRRRRQKMFGMSLAIEIALLILLIVVPIFTSVAQPRVHQTLPAAVTFFGPYLNHRAAQQTARPTTNSTPAIPNPFPHTTAPDINVSSRRSDVPEVISSSDAPEGYVRGAIQVVELLRSTLPAEPPHVAPPEAPEKHPVKLSEGVLEAQLISRIEPLYPALARLTKTEGTVRLHAIISRDGRIISLEVVSGHPLLVSAALEAVRRWRYRPTNLDGEPVEVETSITIIFRLRQ